MSEGDSHQIIATLNHLVGKVEGVVERIDTLAEVSRRNMELHEERDNKRFSEVQQQIEILKYQEVGSLKVEIARAKGMAAVIGGGVGVAVAVLKDVIFRK